MRIGSFLLTCSLAAALSIAIGTLAPAHGAQLVTNGGFETGDFTGWTQFGDTTYNGVDATDPHGGHYEAFFGPVGDTGGIQQTLATTAHSTYDVSFFLKNQGNPPDAFAADFGSTNLVNFSNANAFGYTKYNYLVTATGSSTLLKFIFRQDFSYFELDDVSVTPYTTTTPEPGTVATFASMVFAGSLGLRRARRKKA